MQRSRAFAVVPSIPRSQITRETIASRPGALALHDLAGRIPVLDHCADRQSIADLCAHKCFAQRRAVTANRVAGAELRSRNRESLYDFSPRNQGEFLVRDADHNFGRKTSRVTDRVASQARITTKSDDEVSELTGSICVAGALSTCCVQETRRQSAVLQQVLKSRLTLDLVRNEKLKILDEGIDLAQIFAPALLRFQFAFAHEDGEIAQLVQPLAR